MTNDMDKNMGMKWKLGVCGISWFEGGWFGFRVESCGTQKQLKDVRL